MIVFLFCYALLCVNSSFAIILKRKRKLVDLLLLSYRCIATIFVLWLFSHGVVVWLQCVIVVFPEHTHLLFHYKNFKAYLEIISSDPSIYSMDHPKLLYQTRNQEFISAYKVHYFLYVSYRSWIKHNLISMVVTKSRT